MFLCLIILFSNVIYAADNGLSSTNNKELITETTNGTNYSKVYRQGEKFIEEGSLNGINYIMNRPISLSNYKEYSMTQFDDVGNAEYTVTINDDKQLVQYNHKTGVTTYPGQDGTYIYYAPGQEPRDLQIPINEKIDNAEFEQEIQMSTNSLGSPYYSDYLYSHEIYPIGSQLIYRSAAQDPNWTQISYNTVKGTFYFTAGNTPIATVISALLVGLNLYAQYTGWATALNISRALLIVTLSWDGVDFINDAYIQVRADEYQETHQVTVQLNNSNGPIYEISNTYKYYHTLRINDTSNSYWETITTNSQYDGVWGGGYEVCQSVHTGGDAM